MSRNTKISRPTEADDFMSTADAAKLLFVSRPHVMKLLEQGKLELHHKAGNTRFLTTTSVLAYQMHLRAAAKAYQTSTRDNE
jgi:excisionase family DNA binding protein